MEQQVTFILAGGSMSLPFLQDQLKKYPQHVVIAADRGLESCMALGVTPDYVIGDFDSLDPGVKEKFLSDVKNVTRLNPVKDDTDTEAALNLAFEKTTGDILILGGTGSRLDHVLGNISILAQGLERGRRVMLLDEHNRIRVIDGALVLKREEQFGNYVSLLPLTTEVTGVTLEGMKYPLHKYTLRSDTSIGISNEIAAEEARISFDSGILIVVESRD